MSTTEKFSELLDQNLSNVESNTNDIMKGTVVGITPDFVLVDVNKKSEGIISKSEFFDLNNQLTVKVGDVVEVAFERPEDEFGLGEMSLSHAKAKRIAIWKNLEKAYENEETVTGLVLEPVKGGFTVVLDAVRAFLPGSLIDVRPVRDTSYLVGKEWKFKIVKIDKRRNNVVVSRKAVVEGESKIDKDSLIKSFEEKKKLKGIVKNLTDYGAFVDLGGIDGLLHITDMSWKRIKTPSELLSVGDEIEVTVLKFDPEKHRVSLSMKELSTDPMIEISKKYNVDDKIMGKVTNVTDYGCFVAIDDILEGLVHMSEMDWKNKNIHPSKIVQPGDIVEVKILEIDLKRRRISLGLKQCTENPWQIFAENHKKGDKITGKIRSITDFGLFVGLEGGIDGLVHLSDIPSQESSEKVLRNHKKGEEITVSVLTMDPNRERISLGIQEEDVRNNQHADDDQDDDENKDKDENETTSVEDTEVEDTDASTSTDTEIDSTDIDSDNQEQEQED